MSDVPKSRPGELGTNRQAASEALFNPAAFLETTASGRIISKHSAKEVIFAQGDDADAVFYIGKGKVKVSIVFKEGKEAVIALLGPDEFVGEGCLIRQPKRLATASAVTECETMRVAKTEINGSLLTSPHSRKCLSRIPLERNARIEEDLAYQLFNRKTACPAVAAVGQLWKGGRAEPILAKISQETLAEMIGTTRSRVSHFMNKFRQLGFIDYNGHLEVHNSLVSVLLADQPRTVSPPE
jgi:CRP/FNR family transcriptional regulator, cyclic AMP receptor protein